MHQRPLNPKSIWLALASVFLLTSTLYAAPPSVVTQMDDNGHSGWNPHEARLTVANVKSNFQCFFKVYNDGQTYSQPLYIATLKMGPLGTHNVVFVATENNTVYAFDADKARAPLWSKNLTPPGETLQVADDYNHTRVPQIGITGTPVIDAASGTLYASPRVKRPRPERCFISVCTRSTLQTERNARAVLSTLWPSIREPAARRTGTAASCLTQWCSTVLHSSSFRAISTPHLARMKTMATIRDV